MSPSASAGARSRDVHPVACCRVLLVEDDPALALMLIWDLEERGVTTALATTCDQARELARRIRFELALWTWISRTGTVLALPKGWLPRNPGPPSRSTPAATGVARPRIARTSSSTSSPSRPRSTTCLGC